MRTIISVVLVLTFASATLAAVSMGFFNNPKYPGKCYISKDLILSPGSTKDPNADCGRIICSSDGSAEFQTCGVQMLGDPGFKYGDYVDKSRDYPACCERKVIPA